MKVHNKVFVVTGAGGGIGAELVRVLLSKDAKVAAIDLREDSLIALRQKLGVDTNRLSVHSLDITDLESVRQLPETVIQLHGSVDGLINCAGIIQPFVRVNDLDYGAIERVMKVNFYGTLYMTKAFLPHLLQRAGAHIVNVSSMGGFLPVPGQSVYGASKAAVKLLTEGLYAELLDTKVRVSLVFPGATKTNITQNSNVKAPQVGANDGSDQIKSMMLGADKAAEAIISGIESDRLYILTGKDSRMMNKLYRLSPGFATRLIAKKMKSLLR